MACMCGVRLPEILKLPFLKAYYNPSRGILKMMTPCLQECQAYFLGFLEYYDSDSGYIIAELAK